MSRHVIVHAISYKCPFVIQTLGVEFRGNDFTAVGLHVMGVDDDDDDDNGDVDAAAPARSALASRRACLCTRLQQRRSSNCPRTIRSVLSVWRCCGSQHEECVHALVALLGVSIFT